MARPAMSKSTNPVKTENKSKPFNMQNFSGLPSRDNRKGAFKCKKCYKSFYHKSYFLKHICRFKTTCSERKFMCSSKKSEVIAAVSNFSNENSNNLRSFQNIAGKLSNNDLHKSQNIECALCSNMLSRKSSMIIHLLRVHKIGEGSFNCRKCNTSFYWNSAFQKHSISCLKGRREALTAMAGSNIINNMEANNPTLNE
jgi:hypothetical protein